jgi:hypothetical protein
MYKKLSNIRQEDTIVAMGNGVFCHKSLASGEVVRAFAGIRGQCVELARRTLIENHNKTFVSVDSEKWGHWSRHANGTSFEMPKVGDLVIYPARKHSACWEHGHVAVVEQVKANGKLILAEQNIVDPLKPYSQSCFRESRILATHRGFEILDSICAPMGWISLT